MAIFRRNFKNSNKITKTAPLDVTIRGLSDHALVHCKATDVLLTIYFYHPRRKYGWSKKYSCRLLFFIKH